MQFLQLTGGLGFKMGTGIRVAWSPPRRGRARSHSTTRTLALDKSSRSTATTLRRTASSCSRAAPRCARVTATGRSTPATRSGRRWGRSDGTVNTTDDVAVLISFQSPPDGALYRGERDLSHGTPPEPVPRAESLVQISRMTEVPVNGLPGGVAVEAGVLRRVVSPRTGAAHLEVNHVSLAPGGALSLEPGEHEQVLIVLRGDLTPQGANKGPLTEGGVVFLEPGDALTLRAERDGAILVRAVAGPRRCQDRPPREHAGLRRRPGPGWGAAGRARAAPPRPAGRDRAVARAKGRQRHGCRGRGRGRTRRDEPGPGRRWSGTTRRVTPSSKRPSACASA